MIRAQAMDECRDGVAPLRRIGRRSKPATPADTVFKAPAVFLDEISS